MRLPTPLLRQNPDAYKNQFGHVLVLAGSARMLGAPALCGLAAMRSGAGLTTLGVPKSLNAALQKKISPVLMTWPLAETSRQTFSLKGWTSISPEQKKFSVIALGPGLSQDPQTKKFVQKIVSYSSVPLVIDADALNALADNPNALLRTQTPKILTPHIGEFNRLIKETRHKIPCTRPATQNKKQNDLKRKAADFSKKYRCILVLKGHQTIVSDPSGKTCLNKTGNAGMATAGSGDVLTGMIAAFLAQGVSAFEAARLGVFLHGKAGDAAAKKIGKTAMIATDIIDFIPYAINRVKD